MNPYDPSHPHSPFPNAEDCAWMEEQWGYIGNPDNTSPEAQRMRKLLWRKAARNQQMRELHNAWEPVFAAINRIPWMLFPWAERPLRAIARLLRID